MKLIYSTNPEIALFSELVETIFTHRSVPITLFLCGGSAVKIYKYFEEKFETFMTLGKTIGVTDLSNLVVSFTDDRWFNDLSDENINYNIIYNTGLLDKFKNLKATIVPMTQSGSLEDNSKKFNERIEKFFPNSYKIMIGGMGLDGHTCGILPQTNEQDFIEMYGSKSYSVGVTVNNVHKERLTITPYSIEEIDEHLIYVEGENKKNMLHDLFYEEKEQWLMPAQIFKNLQKVKVFTDIVLN